MPFESSHQASHEQKLSADFIQTMQVRLVTKVGDTRVLRASLSKQYKPWSRHYPLPPPRYRCRSSLRCQSITRPSVQSRRICVHASTRRQKTSKKWLPRASGRLHGVPVSSHATPNPSAPCPPLSLLTLADHDTSISSQACVTSTWRQSRSEQQEKLSVRRRQQLGSAAWRRRTRAR